MIEQQDLDFIRAFSTRRAVVAYTLFALNILIFVLMELSGGSTNDSTLLAWGAKSNAEIDNGEVWRFITPIFIHIGLLHLAFNSYALWIVGPQVEKLYGASRFLLLYVLTGMAGAAASYWRNPGILSAGASGAIFGLFGVLLVFSFKYRKTIPEFFRQALGRGILLTIGINLFIGYMIPHVDNSAHIGGLVAGGLLAMVVPFERPGTSAHPAFKMVQAALVLVIAASFFQVATHYAGPRLSFGNLMRDLRSSRGSGSSVDGYLAAMNLGFNAFELSEKELASGDVKNVEWASRQLAVAIDRLQAAPSVSARANDLRDGLLDISQKQYGFVQEVLRSGTASLSSNHLSGSSPYSRRYGAVKQGFDDWVETEGEKYGIVNTR